MIRLLVPLIALLLPIKCSGQRPTGDKEAIEDYKVVFYAYSQHEFDSLKLLSIDRVRFNDELADFFMNSESLIIKLSALGIKSYLTDERYIELFKSDMPFDKFSKVPGFGVVCIKSKDELLIVPGVKTESDWELIIETFLNISL